MKYRYRNYIASNRKRHALSLDELAGLAGPAKSTMAMIETSERLPSLRVALALSFVFGVPVPSLFAGLQQEVEEHVMARGAGLDEKLRGKTDQASAIKRGLLLDIARRAGGADAA